MSVASVVANLRQVRSRIANLIKQHKRTNEVVLVAVSKTKPVELLRAAYDDGQRHFGENYVQELIGKSTEMPEDTKFHFIGHLQSNKCKALLGIRNLYMVECVDSIKIADRLNKACVDLDRPSLNVLVQVNTSGEASKFGCEPSACVSLVHHVLEKCSRLNFKGVMTIARFDETPKDDCFKCLLDCRDKVAEECKINADDMVVSMGMSGDYDLAIEMGTTAVRIGSTIFGARDYSKKQNPEPQNAST